MFDKPQRMYLSTILNKKPELKDYREKHTNYRNYTTILTLSARKTLFRNKNGYELGDHTVMNPETIIIILKDEKKQNSKSEQIIEKNNNWSFLHLSLIMSHFTAITVMTLDI